MEKQAQDGYMWIPGATTVGIVFKDGVILASEKRVSYGNIIMSRGGKKVFKLTEHIGAACAGLVSDMQILTREMEAYIKLFNLDVGRSISVKSAAKLMSNLLFVDAPPAGHTRLTDWANARASTLGLHYTSELARRMDRQTEYLSN